MKTGAFRRFCRSLATVLISMLLVPGIALAGKCQVGDSTGTTKPKPKEGSRARVKFNPTVTMVVGHGGTLDTFMQRLATTVNLVSLGGYLAVYHPETGELEIVKTGGGELDDLFCGDNDPAIQSIRVIVQGDGLIAYFTYIVEDPSQEGGSLFVTLDDDVIEVSTVGLESATAVNTALRQAIEGAGYQVESVPPYMLVRQAPGNGFFTQAGLRSTDPAIVTFDVGLAPGPNPGSSPRDPDRSPSPSSDSRTPSTSRSPRE